MENKQRHGCVTAWFILMIIGNSLSALTYLFAREFIAQNLPVEIPTTMMIALAILGIGNVVFSIMLINWKKTGFWGFVVSSLLIFIINLIIGLGIVQSLLGLISIGILYAVLQFKKADVSAWDNLD
jgi:hypothetical protein